VDIPPTLVLTNDLPPRIGGVQQYVGNLLARLDPGALTVVAPAWPGWREHDASLGYRVVRTPVDFIWPTQDFAGRAGDLAEACGARVILFTHGFPITGVAGALAARGFPYVVLTHGYEVWMTLAPGVRSALRHAIARSHEVFAISAYTATRLQTVMPPGVPLSLAPPCVDHERFRPGLDGSAFRERHDLGGLQVVGCVSRLVERKGQDKLIEAFPEVLRRVPEAVLVLIGGGPYERELRALAAGSPARQRIRFVGQVPDEDLPAAYAGLDVFAMPCRTRNWGFDFEGFGIVYLEAGASGLPVVAGRSGGAPEAVVDGETGVVVDGRDPSDIARAVAGLLEDPHRAKAMGVAARARVEERFTWDRTAERVARALRHAAT
jgi:phosphatidyl-myo-inositol dimannoside synthase